MSWEANDEGDEGNPFWIASADLMAGVVGLFVLFFVWSIVFQLDLSQNLETEKAARAEAAIARQQAEEARAQAEAAHAKEAARRAELEAQNQAKAERLAGLESAFARSLADGRVTLVDGRIGIAGSLLFDVYSAELRDEGQTLIAEVAAPLSAWLRKHDEMLMVGGFTDDQPILGEERRFEDNWQLSTERALTVVRALAARGIPPERLYAAGFGAHHPAVPNQDDPSRARNRRVEIVPQARGAK